MTDVRRGMSKAVIAGLLGAGAVILIVLILWMIGAARHGGFSATTTMNITEGNQATSVPDGAATTSGGATDSAGALASAGGTTATQDSAGIFGASGTSSTAPAGSASMPAAPNIPPNLLAPADYDHFRALLRSPDIVARQQAVLDRQVSKLPQACPAMHFAADSIVPTAPLRFDTAGRLMAGMMRYRWRGSGCPNGEVLINLWIVARDGGNPLVVASLPGTSVASPQLQRDFFQVAIAAAAPKIACSTLDVVDTRFVAFTGRSPITRPGVDPRRWDEDWIVAGCGHAARVRLHSAPDATGTAGQVAQDSVEVLR